MDDAFKAALSGVLPESLFQQVEPYIDEIIKGYSENSVHVWGEPDGIKKGQAIGNTENEGTTEMSDEYEDATGNKLTVEQWLQIRKEAGLKIDPETAEVWWKYGYTIDPYGVDKDLPEECRQVGREYFALSPGSDIWVWFGDLPDEVRERLWKMHQSKLAFPAGLFCL
jgi:hypothetical protein